MIYLYAAAVPEFVKDAQIGKITSLLEEAFLSRHKNRPRKEEATSWTNSLKALATILNEAAFDETYILLEAEMPLCSKRCDAILVGDGIHNTQNAVVIELKQWTNVKRIDSVLFSGGKYHTHPSVQVQQYCDYLKYYNEAFTEGKVFINGCAFLHDMESEKAISVLKDPYYTPVSLNEYPAFTGRDRDEFRDFLTRKVSGGGGQIIADKLKNAVTKPSTKLLDVVADAVQNNFEWKLLGNQKLAFDFVLSKVKDAKEHNKKHVVIVRGGPGTGKSVVAIQLLAYAARFYWRVAYATGNKALNDILRAQTQKFANDLLKRTYQAKYLNRIPVEHIFATFSNIATIGSKKENDLDLVVGDEAHRLWEYRINPRTKQRISETLMIQEVVRASRVTVFFLDDNQSVRANEVGSVKYIESKVKDMGIDVDLIDLSTQFRCSGSQDYIDWVDNVMSFNTDSSLSWTKYDQYDFRIVNSMQEMQRLIDIETDRNNRCRMIAGFCWKWSELPLIGTNLVHDVTDKRFNGWSAPWIEKGAQDAEPADSRYYKWATNNSYKEQVGSIYSIQGIEFDYIGLIFGEDLVWRNDKWISDLSKNKDRQFKENLAKENPTEKLRNIYRVLLTRGMKGTYVFFLDEETRNHFQTKLMRG